MKYIVWFMAKKNNRVIDIEAGCPSTYPLFHERPTNCDLLFKVSAF